MEKKESLPKKAKKHYAELCNLVGGSLKLSEINLAKIIGRKIGEK